MNFIKQDSFYFYISSRYWPKFKLVWQVLHVTSTFWIKIEGFGGDASLDGERERESEEEQIIEMWTTLLFNFYLHKFNLALHHGQTYIYF